MIDVIDETGQIVASDFLSEKDAELYIAENSEHKLEIVNSGNKEQIPALA